MARTKESGNCCCESFGARWARLPTAATIARAPNTARRAGVSACMCSQQSISVLSTNASRRYVLHGQLGQGHFGEVWLADESDSVADAGDVGEGAAPPEPRGGEYVLKRIFVEAGDAVRLSGLREVYFGRLFAREAHIARFVEAFAEAPFREREQSDLTRHREERKGACEAGTENVAAAVVEQQVDEQEVGEKAQVEKEREVEVEVEEGEAAEAAEADEELWLVFYNEGQSLHSLLYEGGTRGHEWEGSFVVFQRTAFWRELKRQPAVMRSLVRQLLEAAAVVHAHNVTHRDIKPQNILLRQSASGSLADIELRLADFGSALDPHTLHMYPPGGPTAREQTRLYSPPEALFSEEVVYFAQQPHAFDMWSVGVVWLELVLGTSQVFQLEHRTAAVLDARMRHASAAERARAHLLRALTEYCIYPPRAGHSKASFGRAARQTHSSSGVRTEAACTVHDLQRVLVRLDPMGVGMPSVWDRHLLLRLLEVKRRGAARSARVSDSLRAHIAVESLPTDHGSPSAAPRGVHRAAPLRAVCARL